MVFSMENQSNIGAPNLSFQNLNMEDGNAEHMA